MEKDRFEAVVEKMIPGGDGLARIDGEAHFIPDSLPGERVRGSILERRKGWVRSGTPEVLDPSPHRREPFCPVYRECGGCSWQHIDSRYQLELKTSICIEALERQGKLTSAELPEIVPFAAEPRGYRARIRPVILPDGRAAFRGASSGRTVAIEHCPVATPAVNSFLAHPPAGLDTGSEPVVFGTDDRFFVQGLDEEAVVPVAGREFRFPPGAFFQSSIAILPSLLDFALGDAGPGNVALDLYGGVGLFGAFLADRFKRVIGVDRDRRAADSWRRHVGPTGKFHAGSLEKWIRSRTKARPDFVVVDPPRSGLDRTVRRGLIDLKAPEISYVSCDPVTQARDLRDLLSAGYRLEAYGVFDLYPQTPHVETVARLTYRQSESPAENRRP